MTDDSGFVINDRRRPRADDLGQPMHAGDVDGDPHDRPGRRLIGPAHAHLDAPCTDACYTDGDPAAEFAAVIDQARAVYRPGVPDDELPPPPPPPGEPQVMYLAACQQCPQVDASGLPQRMAVPFARKSDRDHWANGHASARGHVVSLVEQHPASGSTITGRVDPDGAPPPAVGVAAYEPPLIAFVVRSGKDPDLLCTIPERAGAAWLLTAAHACLLGRGSLGVPQPDRALYVGRLTPPSPHEQQWHVRIDGVLAAGVDDRIGDAVGMRMQVDGNLGPAQVEDVCEALIAGAHGIGRHLFSVVVMADPGVGDVADPAADDLLRQQRLAARDSHRAGGGQPVDAVAEFVDREIRGPVAEVADVGPDR